MPNPIFEAMYGARPQQNTAGRMAQVFSQAKSMMRGNPEEVVRSLISSGQMTQAQLDSLGREATQLMKQLPGVFR